MAALLGLVKLAGLEQMWAFETGSVLSTACGAALIVVVWRLGPRLGFSPMARGTIGSLLALAGPLAVWSNSALETVPFALAFTVLLSSTLPGVRRPWGTTAAALVVLLLRIDGVFFAGVWLLARIVSAEAADRRVLWQRVGPAVALSALAYTGWRVWYFGAWLPLPLQSKVAHKLLQDGATVVRTAEVPYLLDFARRAGLPLLAGLLTMMGVVTWRDNRRRVVWALGASVAILGAYVGLVGDWMFGFRFTVALLAPLALLMGYGLTAIERYRPTVARLVSVVLLVWSAFSAWGFHTHWRQSQGKPVFWASPSLDPVRTFGEYYEIYRTLQPLVKPGRPIAYHEAGFVPFLFDVENIDMLGLCSRFVGAMPTRDAILTDVGRYYPLTERPPFHAVHAYLIYREPSLIVVRRSWMISANNGHVPGEVLGGHYRVAVETARFVVYERTAQARDPRRTVVDGFLENLAHPAYARRVAINGSRLAPDSVAGRLPSLWQGPGHAVAADPAWALHIDRRDEDPVHEVYLEGSPPDQPLRVVITLEAADRRTFKRIEAHLPAGQPIRIWEALPERVDTDSIDIRFTSLTGSPVRFHLAAVRIMGQTEALRAHLKREGIPDGQSATRSRSSVSP